MSIACRSRTTPALVLALILTTIALSVAASDWLSYDLDVSVDYASGTFEGTAVIELTNRSNTAHEALLFRLFANDATLYGDAHISVERVSLQTQSLPIATFIDETVLLAQLPSPLTPGETTELTIVFSGAAEVWLDEPSQRESGSGYGILTRSSNALVLTSFYPMLAVFTDRGWALDPSTGFGDTLYGDAADYRVTVRSTHRGDVASTGVLIDHAQSNEQRVLQFQAENARDFALVLLDGHQAIDTVSEGITIRSWFLSNTQAREISDRVAVDSLLLFEGLVGPSPFSEIELVDVPLSRAAGVEFSGLILVSSSYAAQPTDLFFTIIVSHEMAHQWFYAGVGSDPSEYPWLDEGFATFLAYEYLRIFEGDSVAQDQFEQARGRLERAADNQEHLSIASPRYAFPDASTYNSFVYSGAATFLDDVRQEVGNELFFEAVRAYYSASVFGLATPSDLIQAIQGSCNCSLDELLSSYHIVP